MDKLEFNKIVDNCLREYGFSYKRKNYYLVTDQIIIMINLQKSNFDSVYYINYAFVIKDLHKDKELPLLRDCDIMGRFSCIINEKTYYDFKLELLTQSIVELNISQNIESVLEPVIKSGINVYFDMYPQAIYTASQPLKKYLHL